MTFPVFTTRIDVRQLRQVLMYWPINYDKPKIKLSLADDPTKSFTRQPDKVLKIALDDLDLHVYYFGLNRPENDILNAAYYLY